MSVEIESATLEEKIEQSLDVLEETWDRFDDPIFTCSFGKDSNTVLDLLDRSTTDITTQTALGFCDHGNHFEDTLRLKEELEDRYGVTFDTYRPESSYEELVEEHGPRVNQRKPDLCCETLKSKPIERMVDGHDGWITGYRIAEGQDDEGEASYDWRSNLDFFEEKEEITHINPIVHWTDDDVWEYHDRRDLPYNEIYDEGFDCTGCKQCTLDGEVIFAVDSMEDVGEGEIDTDD